MRPGNYPVAVARYACTRCDYSCVRGVDEPAPTRCLWCRAPMRVVPKDEIVIPPRVSVRRVLLV